MDRALTIVSMLSRLVYCLPLFVPAVAAAQGGGNDAVHWAYAAYFGSGWYRLTNDREAFVLTASPRWTHGDASISADGRREVAYTLRVPVTAGLARLDIEDIPDVIDPDNLVTASVNLGVDADVPINSRFSLRPAAELGYGRALGEDVSAWTYSVELRGRWRLRTKAADWVMVGGAGAVGFDASGGEQDDFTFAWLGTEYSQPVSWFPKTGDQTLLHWHLIHTDFFNEVEVISVQGPLDAISDFWQFGVSLGRRNAPLRIGFLRFDRLGLAWNASASGDFRGVNLVFRSIYEY